MGLITVQFEDTVYVNKHKDILIITVNCIPSEGADKYAYSLVVKAKRFNRKKTHKGEIILNKGSDKIQQVKDHIKKNNLLKSLEDKVVESLLRDFPNYFPYFEY